MFIFLYSKNIKNVIRMFPTLFLLSHLKYNNIIWILFTNQRQKIGRKMASFLIVIRIVLNIT